MLSKADMDKLKEHSKLHKGGMNSKHIKNMKKFMEGGDSFSKAHSRAMKLDKEEKKMANGKNGLSTKQKKNLPPQLKEAIRKKKATSKPKKRKVMNNPKVGKKSSY